ncbi:S-adenosyl-L-methionine-dependent methyltransferase [Annulohypoxylon maeteangense]|uniref:S-adenosyl-L-methionine-dependent methyltransferase n=1 Tax=Annulohypoxylon maeteangense TaxID=1927788 RepID=UPI002008E96C|nr:S-adenosyl-L-methionine-dependent methyltransferase [Annulohypoxylon maeteangense]KAI0883035.1 S-adenosyl-L-methionine-dependent methyltransferase [Annulohypoxylon maeteangense]
MRSTTYRHLIAPLQRGSRSSLRQHHGLAISGRGSTGFQRCAIRSQVPGTMHTRARCFSSTATLREEAEDSENFWRVSADDSQFWHDYVSTRPSYNAAFYNEIYNHHNAHSSKWEVAHDVGCGAGQVCEELATRFAHVVASDINDTHLAVAKRRLIPSLGAKRISFTHSMGEDLIKHHAPGSADLIAAAEAMVLMDEHVALENFHRLLRPGGTLAFWFYGRPTFSDLKLRAKAQPLIDGIMVRNWSKVIRGSERRIAGFKRAAEGMASWLDYVPLDPESWSNVRRIKWNTSATLPFFGEEACGFPIHPTSNVKPGEYTEEREDPNWWKNEWDIAELRRYFRVLFPGFKEALGEGDQEINRMFQELESHFGGEGKTQQFTWPAVLVTATRK